MTARDKAKNDLESNGYTFARHGKKHDIYLNKDLGCMIPLKRHDFDDSDLRYIQKEIKNNKRDRG